MKDLAATSADCKGTVAFLSGADADSVEHLLVRRYPRSVPLPSPAHPTTSRFLSPSPRPGPRGGCPGLNFCIWCLLFCINSTRA